MTEGPLDDLGALEPEPARFDPRVPGLEGIDKEARDREMHREHMAIDDAVRAEEEARRQQAQAAEREQFAEQVKKWQVTARADAPPAQDLEKFEPAKSPDDLAAIGNEGLVAATEELDPLGLGRDLAPGEGFARGGQGEFVGRQAHAPHGSRKRTVVPEAPGDSEQEGLLPARAEPGDVPERQAHPAHGEQRQAHPRHGAPQRQAHPAHGSSLPKKPLLILGIGMLIAVVTVSVAVAGPRPAPAPAAPAAAVLTPQPDATAPATAPAAAPATRATPTAAPIGATIVVTPYHRWTGSGGACTGEQRLEPKAVANPPVGESVAYEWDVTWPSCAASRSWGIDYPRETFSAANTLFRPKTTYSISPLERGTCAAGMCRQPMVVIVKNEGS